MKRKSVETKKNKTDVRFEKRLMEKILDGGDLEEIAQVVRSFYKENWKGVLFEKVG